MNNKKSMIKNIIFILKPYRKSLFVIFICIILSMCMQMIIPFLNKKMIDDGFANKNYKLILLFCCIIFIIFLLDRLLDFTRFLLYATAKNKLHYSLYYRALQHWLRLKVLKLKDSNSQELLKKIDLDIDNISRLLDGNIMDPAAGVLKILGGLIGLALINWQMALILLLFIPFKVLAVRCLYRLRIKCLQELRKAYHKIEFWYGDTLNGINEIKLWGLYRKKLAEFTILKRKELKAFFKVDRSGKINENSELILQEFMIGIVIYLVSARFIISGDMTLGGLFSFVSYAAYVLLPISSLANLSFEMPDIILSLNSYMDFMDESIEQDCKRIIRGNWRQDRIPEKIVFHKVGLRLGNNTVLEGVSFTAYKGSRIAIAGTNGSGKTSLINLLLRFYEATTGAIFLDDVDITTIDGGRTIGGK